MKDEKELKNINTLQQETAMHEQTKEERNYFFTHSVNIFCTTGLDGYFKSVNPAFEKTLGYTKEEIFAKPLIEFIHSDDRLRTITVRQKIFSNGEPIINFENRFWFIQMVGVGLCLYT